MSVDAGVTWWEQAVGQAIGWPLALGIVLAFLLWRMTR